MLSSLVIIDFLWEVTWMSHRWSSIFPLITHLIGLFLIVIQNIWCVGLFVMLIWWVVWVRCENWLHCMVFVTWTADDWWFHDDGIWHLWHVHLNILWIMWCFISSHHKTKNETCAHHENNDADDATNNSNDLSTVAGCRIVGLHIQVLNSILVNWIREVISHVAHFICQSRNILLPCLQLGLRTLKTSIGCIQLIQILNSQLFILQSYSLRFNGCKILLDNLNLLRILLHYGHCSELGQLSLCLSLGYGLLS